MRNIYYKPDGAWHLTQEEVAWINGAVEREAALRSQVEELTQEREQLKANLATRTFAANINSNAAKARKLDLQEAEAKLAAAHSVMEKFADDLDTGPSTRLLATELRNRWRAALAAAEQPTQEQPE